jgi:hypothetical protein
MLMMPEVTPTGAIAPMVVLFVTKKLVAGIPLKVTVEALVKLFPVIFTIVPAAPFVGVKLMIEAGREKIWELITEPLVVVTVMGPEVAVAGTLNVSVPAEIVPKEVTTPPPTMTTGPGDASFNPAPVSVTSVPTGPEVGEKFKIVGRILKSSVEVAAGRIVPAGGDTVILPVDAFAGTVTRMLVLLEMVKSLAATPPNEIAEMAVKFVPVSTTFVPGRPFVGEKLLNIVCA